jgi:hypothetical protein
MEMNAPLLKEAQAESSHRPLCAGVEKNMANQSASASLTPAPAIAKMEDPSPLCAAHTPNFPALLRQLGASLLVTTYQAGKLVMVRDEGPLQHPLPRFDVAN